MEIMTKEDYVKELQIFSAKIYNAKEKTEDEWDRLERGIRYLIAHAPTNNSEARMLYAKAKYERGEYYASERTFAKVKAEFPAKNRQCLNGLLKAYIMQSKFLNAYNTVIELEIDLEQGKSQADFGLIKALLSYLCNVYGEVEVSYDQYMYATIHDEQLLEVYGHLIESVAEYDFESAIIYAYQCGLINECCNPKTFIEFKTLFKLLIAAKRKDVAKCKDETSYELDEFIRRNDYYGLYQRLVEFLDEYQFSVKVEKYKRILKEKGYSKLADLIDQKLQSLPGISEEEIRLVKIIDS